MTKKNTKKPVPLREVLAPVHHLVFYVEDCIAMKGKNNFDFGVLKKKCEQVKQVLACIG